jgi:hypothetical protein
MRLLIFALAAATLSPTAAEAQSLCEGLWAERNAVYARAGYCFRTPRGIAAFGNAGCRFDDIGDVPLSARDRSRVAVIVSEERRLGCPR